VVLLDLRQLSPIADYFLVCSGSSDVHVRAICDAVSEGLVAHAESIKPWHVEGYDTRRGVLLDYVHVVVHIFQSETREYYSLERLWGDAPRRALDDAPAGAAGADR
jgi:ribosome-associated protein